MSRPVRVGLLLDSFDVEAWVWTAIRELSASQSAGVVAVAMEPGAQAGGARSPRVPEESLPFRGALRRIDEVLERRIPTDQDAFTSKDLKPLLADVPVLWLTQQRDVSTESVADEDVARLRALDLDVLLWLEDRSPPGGILDVARAGVWSLNLGDSRKRRGGPPGFWEVHEGWPVTGASLEILGGDADRDQTIARTSTATVPTSIKRTRNALVWTALPLLGRALEQLYVQGAERFLERVAQANASPTFYSNPLYRSPGLADVLVHGARRTARLAELVARKRFSRRQWVLYYGLADDLVQACWRLQPLVPPIDRFWADPHVLKVRDRYFIFVEELLYASGKGHISVIEVDEDGRVGPARPVLEEPHHLSYPLVFEHDGDFFMIPESAARGTIDLYRATSFPNRWVFVEHLMTGIEAYDATLLRERDRWWLFASVVKYKGAGSGELNLYSSDRLLGGAWRLHPASPLSSEVSTARPAGAIVRRNGRLYRPVQDGSGLYGRAIKLHEILELTETTYREQHVTGIEPAWDRRITRTHTLAHAGRLTVVDALWTRYRWATATPGQGSAAATDDQRRRSVKTST